MDDIFQKSPEMASLFNITYTFRTDSTVLFPYGRVVDKTIKHLKDAPRNPDPVWLEPPPKELTPTIKVHLAKKTKDILWMVSHCETDSKREKYVEELQNSTGLKIDILGKCGEDGLLPSETEKTVGKLQYKEPELVEDSWFETL